MLQQILVGGNVKVIFVG